MWPPGLDLEALAEREPEKPRFIMLDWLPVGYAALLAGHGGVGKSGIALHLAVCVAAGIPFFGIEVDRRRVLYLSCEDRENVLHWRLARICAHAGVNLAGLRGWLEIVDLVGHDCVLWERDPRTGYTVKPDIGDQINKKILGPLGAANDLSFSEVDVVAPKSGNASTRSCNLSTWTKTVSPRRVVTPHGRGGIGPPRVL